MQLGDLGQYCLAIIELFLVHIPFTEHVDDSQVPNSQPFAISCIGADISELLPSERQIIFQKLLCHVRLALLEQYLYNEIRMISNTDRYQSQGNTISGIEPCSETWQRFERAHPWLVLDHPDLYKSWTWINRVVRINRAS